MAKADKFVVGTHPERGRLWAAFDPSVVYSPGKVGERRFVAFLTPFRTRELATAALVAEGCTVELVTG